MSRFAKAYVGEYARVDIHEKRWKAFGYLEDLDGLVGVVLSKRVRGKVTWYRIYFPSLNRSYTMPSAFVTSSPAGEFWGPSLERALSSLGSDPKFVGAAESGDYASTRRMLRAKVNKEGEVEDYAI